MERHEKSDLLAQLIKLLAPEEQTNAPQQKTLSAVCQELETMNNRLALIENELTERLTRTVQLRLAPHPSQERFQIVEANELLLPGTKEKACRFEPDKPCDYCSMCSSRGF